MPRLLMQAQSAGVVGVGDGMEGVGCRGKTQVIVRGARGGVWENRG